MARAPDQTDGFSRVYGRLLEEFAAQIGEKRPAYGQAGRNVREEIVRCVWFGGHFPQKGLSTDAGDRLEVLSPGWWNVEGGPDFIRAEFLLEGSGRVVGDVEVHTLASAWYGHGHDRQPEYNDVALHVVMWNDRDEDVVEAENGASIPQLTLSEVVERDLEELVEIIDRESEEAPAEWPSPEGRFCGRAYLDGQIDAGWLGRLLDAAGDHRVLTRAAAISELFQNHSREQILYEKIAEALGYKNNRMPFMQLAGLLPMRELRGGVPADASPEEKALLIEAAMFRAGGFLAYARELDEPDEETSDYLDRLREAAGRAEAPETTVQLSRDHWQFGATRPVNYPGRRLAALALLCAAHLDDGLFSHFLRTLHGARPGPRQRPDTALRSALMESFLGLEHPYWSHHYTLGGARVEKARALVGRSRARSILIDVLIPCLLAHARRDDDTVAAERLHAVWRGMPRRSSNAVTRRMEQVIFQSRDAAREVVDSTRRQQGLHQLYRDCCRRDGGCEQCVLYLAQRAGKTLAGV